MDSSVQSVTLSPYNRNKVKSTSDISIPFFGAKSRHLPLEILSKIFSHLTEAPHPYQSLGQAALVSNAWRLVAEDPQLWKQYKLPVTRHVKAEDFLAALTLDRFQHITQLQYVATSKYTRFDIQYHLQLNIEMLSHVPHDLLFRARQLVCCATHSSTPDYLKPKLKRTATSDCHCYYCYYSAYCDCYCYFFCSLEQPGFVQQLPAPQPNDVSDLSDLSD